MTRLFALLALAFTTAALAQGYVCAEGGGNPGKGAWADEVFGWMVQAGKNGPAVIIGAVPLDAADQPDSREALFTKLGAKSCTSLVIDDKNADAQATYDAITAATIIFIRGGAQERYVNWWKGTKTEAAIHAVFDNGGVVAGTSAGCAILGEVTYDSKNGSLKPLEALQDARHPHLTLTTDFLGLVPGVLFDTHFTERGRLARLPVMLAQARDDLHRDDVMGIGVDPRTALCVDPDGTAVVKGEGAVTLIEFVLGTRTLLEAGKPPAVACALYSRLPSGSTIDLKSKAVASPTDSVTPDRGAGLQPMALDGRGGDVALAPQGDEDKSKPAPLPPLPPLPPVIWPVKGEGRSGVIATQNTWAHPNELVTRAVQILALSPGRVAFLLGPGNGLVSRDGQLFAVDEAKDEAPAAALVIDSGAQRQELTAWRQEVTGAWAGVVAKRQSAEMDRLQNQVIRVVQKHGRLDKFQKLLDSLTDSSANPPDADVAPQDAQLVALMKEEQLLRSMYRAATESLDDADQKELGDLPRVDTGALRMDPTDEPDVLRQLESQPNGGLRPSIYRAKLHILPPGWSIDLQTGAVTRPAKPTPQPPGP